MIIVLLSDFYIVMSLKSHIFYFLEKFIKRFKKFKKYSASTSLVKGHCLFDVARYIGVIREAIYQLVRLKKFKM